MSWKSLQRGTGRNNLNALTHPRKALGSGRFLLYERRKSFFLN
jgi:hypothetical protein